MNTTTAIRGGTVIDATGSRKVDVVVDSTGCIVEVGTNLDADSSLDASGCVVSPGLVDLHVHLREPGREEAETIETGARGAALGGFTAILAMPNTTPAVDTAAMVNEIRRIGRATACDVHTSGAITVGRKGKSLSPMAEMVRAGVRVFTDDGAGVQDPQMMRTALEYAGSLTHLSGGRRIVLAQHCEVAALSEGGFMHEGRWSGNLGIPGQPAEAEELMVMRDIALAKLTGVHVHFQHMSTAGSVAMIRAAKQAGLTVSAEATTHHFTLTDESCSTYDPVFKVHPPLRTDLDVAAVRDGLADGTIDAIATDHAPHTPEDKELTFADAPPGMLGLETAFALANTELDLPIEEILALMSWRPAAIAGLDPAHGGPIVAGAAANLAVIDPAAEWIVSGTAMASRSNNTPYEGRKVRGRVRHTILAGRPVVVDGEALL